MFSHKVGALLNEATGEYLAGEPCSEAGLSGGAVAGLVIAVTLVTLLVGLGAFRFLRKHRSGARYSQQTQDILRSSAENLGNM